MIILESPFNIFFILFLILSSSFSFSIILFTSPHRSNSIHCTNIQSVFIHTISIQLRLLHYNCLTSKEDRHRITIVNDDTLHANPWEQF